jgi:hypothetical protein
MAKTNRKAKSKADMEKMLFGDTLHPTHKQIVDSKKRKRDLRRQENRQINLSRFSKITKLKKPKFISYQIQRGYDITKKWKDEYDNK